MADQSAISPFLGGSGAGFFLCLWNGTPCVDPTGIYWVTNFMSSAHSHTHFFCTRPCQKVIQTSVALGSGWWRVSRQLGPWISRNLIITQDLHQWGRTRFGPAHTTEPPGHKPLVVNVIVVGPFKEEEEGAGIASDVVVVEGEDPDTPG